MGDTRFNDEEIKSLIKHFTENTFNSVPEDVISQKIMQNCIYLATLDYEIDLVPNHGELCSQYPSHVILFLKEKNYEYCYDTEFDFSKYKDKVAHANVARCRKRFPVPVLLCKNRYIWRSATLASNAEIYARQGLKYFYSEDSDKKKNYEEEEVERLKEDYEKFDEEIKKGKLLDKESKYWAFVNCLEEARAKDIELLKSLKVNVIGDLMVENKKQKFGFYITSSEKVDKLNRYSDFTIMSLPYPGCEFFQELRKNSYEPCNLFYDWNQYFIDTEINVPDDELNSDICAQMQIKWKEYRKWNLTTLTQNYIHLILRYLTEGNNSVLVHCISGWDRTPLFISLLRLSLWADGLAHQSLTPHQILYFTIAYDWYLFGHNLRDRLAKYEEIFYFCFLFLKNIISQNYSMNRDDPIEEPPSETPDSGETAQLPSQLSVGSNQSISSQNGSRDSQDNLAPQFFSIDDELINGNLMPSSPNRDSITNGSPRSPLSAPEKSRASNRTSPLSVTNNRTSPPQLSTSTKRTSPIPISMPQHSNSRPLRSRTESNSSDSSGFCIVTQTGSISSTISQGHAMECASNLASTNTLIEENLPRRLKLERVREIAISAYNKVVSMIPL